MLKIALAGFSQGYYATTYLRCLARLKTVEIIGICDCGEPDSYVLECAFVTAESFAREMEAPLVHSYKELLELCPNAVLICSETVQHAEMAARAMEAGIHVFAAKPLCFLPEQAAALRKVRNPRLCLLCGNPLKYEQGIEEMHTRIRGNEIGRVYSLRLMVNHLAMTEQEWERDPVRSGGPLGTYGVYLFDLARWLTGESLVCVYALADNYATPQIACWDTVKVLAKGAKGTQFSLELYSAIRHPYPFIQVEAVGMKGTLVTKYDNYATVGQMQQGAVFGSLRLKDMGEGEMEHFLDCVKTGAKERCSLEDMDYVTRCIEAVNQSIGCGGPVPVRMDEEEEK